MFKFNLQAKDDFQIIHIDLEGVVAEPAELVGLIPPEIDPQKGVIISGRAPIWLHAMLTHYYHPSVWIAVYDPRLKGGVVVATHSKDKKVGDIVPV